MPTPVACLLNRPLNDVQLGLERRQRLERFAQLHLLAGAFGPPVIGVDAAAHEQRGEALGKIVPAVQTAAAAGLHVVFRRSPRRESIRATARPSPRRRREGWYDG